MLKIRRLRVVVCYQNIKTEGEDFVITPFLFGVWNKKFHALGVCFWWYAFCIGLVSDAPKNLRRFHRL